MRATTVILATLLTSVACIGVEESTCLTEGPVVDIVDNHLPSGGDHELVIPTDDVEAGVEETYDIRGDNTGHTHTVVLTADDFMDLQVGTSVTVTSSNNGSAGNSHTHEVEISCP